MLFNSFAFLVFLPVVFVLYWKVFHGRTYRNLFLVAASYLFYGWWDVRFLALILFTTVCSYILGLYIDRWRSGRPLRAKWIVGLNVAINLGLLGVFKYFNFFSSSFAAMMASAGWKVDAVTLDLILPVGISFYTFQALSYTIDVYRGDIRATCDAAAFFVFISFFPQLVAGPIERSTNLLPQFLRKPTFDYAEAVSGMKLILWGLFKKMVVADNAAPVVDNIFGSYETAGTLNLWMGAVLFTFQIYCDFSGYSDIAIGVGRLFGIRLRRNFDRPYFSTSIHDFWKRWHISLTSWFRDYVYIPLGGNRHGRPRTIANTMAVFLVSGLWHGANYTFIAWGGYHALLYVPHVLRGKRQRSEAPSAFRLSLAMGTTFLLVMVGWILFRANHISEAFQYIGLMFSHYIPSVPVQGKMALLWCLIMMVSEWCSRKGETPFDFGKGAAYRSRPLRWGIYAAVFVITLIFAGTSEQFIYFQF